MRLITTTGGKQHKVDDEDFIELNDLSFTTNKGGYARCWSPPWRGKELHVIIAIRMGLNPRSGMKVDHINHDITDCRRHNLRLITDTESAQWRRGVKGSKVGEKCICLTRDDKYRVEVQAHGVRHSCGTYLRLPAAIIARDRALKKYHGEFAYT